MSISYAVAELTHFSSQNWSCFYDTFYVVAELTQFSSWNGIYFYDNSAYNHCVDTN